MHGIPTGILRTTVTKYNSVSLMDMLHMPNTVRSSVVNSGQLAFVGPQKCQKMALIDL